MICKLKIPHKAFFHWSGHNGDCRTTIEEKCLWKKGVDIISTAYTSFFSTLPTSCRQISGVYMLGDVAEISTWKRLRGSGSSHLRRPALIPPCLRLPESAPAQTRYVGQSSRATRWRNEIAFRHHNDSLYNISLRRNVTHLLYLKIAKHSNV